MKLSNQDFSCFDRMTFQVNGIRNVLGVALFIVFGQRNSNNFTSHTSLLFKYLKDKLHD